MSKAKSFIGFVCEDDAGPNVQAMDVVHDADLVLSDTEMLDYERFYEADPSLQPPKRWWNKMVNKGKSPEIIGYIWYHKLSPEKRAEIRGREGKSYGPAKKD